MKKYKGIIFDFNGVLLWDTPWHDVVWQEVSLQLRGKKISEEEMNTKVHGRNNLAIYTNLLGRDVSAEFSNLVKLKEEKYKAYALSQKENFKLSPGAEEFLDYLIEEQIPITIATNAEVTNVNFWFEHLSLDKWFDFTKVVYDDGSLPAKPDPTMYNLAAKKINLDTAECIVVEDTLVGIEAARLAHIGKIIALGPKETYETFYKIDGVAEVVSRLDEISKDNF